MDMVSQEALKADKSAENITYCFGVDSERVVCNVRMEDSIQLNLFQ